MNQQPQSRAIVTPLVARTAAGRAPDRFISELVGDVYESAPMSERGRLLEQLLRPLAILPLFDIAGGVFVKPRLRGGWHDLHIRLEDIQAIRAADVAALVDHVQRFSVEAVGALAGLLRVLPATSASATAVLLSTALLQRAQRSRGDPAEAGDAAAGPR
jgi:hypothetical protein